MIKYHGILKSVCSLLHRCFSLHLLELLPLQQIFLKNNDMDLDLSPSRVKPLQTLYNISFHVF